MKTFSDYWRNSQHSPEKIEERCREHYASLLEFYFPAGRIVGSDWKMASVEGGEGNSFSFQIKTGIWKDFSDEKVSGKGFLKLLAKSRNTSIDNVMSDIIAHLKLDIKNSETLSVPMPKGLSVLALGQIAQWGGIEGHWCYRDIDGSVLFYRVRYRKSGDQAKRFTDLTYSIAKDSLVTKSLPGITPLYKLDEIAKNPNANILITEGEKDCDAAQILLNDHFEQGSWLSTAWPGGANAITKICLHHLKDRKVWLWPDNDGPGNEAMREFARILKKNSITNEVRLVQLNADDGLPPKFGLADPDAHRINFPKYLEEAVLVAETGDSREWCYLTDIKRFVRFEDGRMMDVEAFNLAHLYLSKNMSKELLTDPAFKRFDTFTYWPGKGRSVIDQTPSGATVEAYNLWTPGKLRVGPDTSRDTPRWDEHCENVFPQEEYRNHFLNWIAYQVQNPGMKIMHSVLLQGRSGVGKTYFPKMFEKFFGYWNIAYVNGTVIKSGYTGFMKNSQLVVINELYDLARREVTNILKELITDPFYQFNEKYVASSMKPNRANFFFTTNHEDSVLLEADDRRFFVYFSPMQPRDPMYYERLFGAIEEEAPGIYLKLMERDLAGFSASMPPPATPEKEEIIESSRSALDTYLEQMRVNEEWPMTSGKFTVKSLMGALKTAYGMRTMSDHLLGRALRKNGFVKGSQIRTDTGRSWVWYTSPQVLKEDEERGNLNKLPVDLQQIVESDKGKG